MALPPTSALFEPVSCMPAWVGRYAALPNTTVSSGCSVNSAGNVNCDPATMAAAAGRTIGRPVSLEAYTLARYVTSEVGTRSVAERVAVIQAALNRVRYTEPKLGNVLNLLLYRQSPGHPNRGFYGPIHGSELSAPYGRWAATSRDPALSNLILAIDILNGDVPADFAKGADDQYGPEILVQKQGLATTQAGVRRRGSESKYWVGPLPGVDHMRTFLYTTRRDISPQSAEGQALINRGVVAMQSGRPNWESLKQCAAVSATPAIKLDDSSRAAMFLGVATALVTGAILFARRIRARRSA